jgi:hypothetical protein
MNIKNNGANYKFRNDDLVDFLDKEINKDTYRDIVLLLELENVREFEYEGNMYVIKRVVNDTAIEIIDEVGEEHGVSREQSRFKIETEKLIDAILAYMKSKGCIM